ncbi:STAS domain-containing protein [Spirillospora sp. NPDC048911]|uniref:STAS domain-containing protein n=1 Tax=Spirillospora sp. NPDC048911 TaxID=3364527 RepID=UPI00371C7747
MSSSPRDICDQPPGRTPGGPAIHSSGTTAMEALHLTTTERGHTITIAVSGELDISTIDQLREHIRRIVQTARIRHDVPRYDCHVHVDLDGLSFVDASGLGALIAIHTNAHDRGVALAFTRIPAHLHRILTITGLHEHLTSPPANRPPPTS